MVWWRKSIRLGLFLCICVAVAACSSQRTRPNAQNSIAKERSSAKPRGRYEYPEDGRPFPRDGKYGLLWPVEGQVTSRFGPRRSSFHDGLDISAPLGTPILAAASGEVIYSGALRGYGNLVILRHRDGYATVYAHTQKNLVKEGERVRRGQAIARVGQTGRASGPHLHFEIRKNNRARNPLRYLPEDRRTVQQDR